jgi:DNA ligase-1
MDTCAQVIQALETHNLRTNKEQIILAQALAGNSEFFQGCRMALDNMTTFGIKQIAEKTDDNGRGLSWAAFVKTAEALSNRQLTGLDAQTAVAHARMKATREQWNYWYRRILIKDLRCGVSEKTLNKVVAKKYPEYSIPVFACQLAHDSQGRDDRITGEQLIEVKLDGVRVISIVHPNGHVEQFSRNGKQLVNFDLIRQQLSRNAFMFAEPVVLDGEVMSASFQDLMKQVHRKMNVKADDAVLHLFDIVTLREFQAGRGQHRQIDRSFSLAAWYRQAAEHMPNVTVIGQELVDLREPAGQARFRQINQEAIDGGYEGIMIKDPSAVYECKRVQSWLKMKPFIEVSLAVTAVEAGTGRNQHRLGALICEGVDDGRQITVNVGSGFTDTEREEYWQNQQLLLGQLVEIRADAVTQSQDGTYSLRFPRFLHFRGFAAGEKI